MMELRRGAGIRLPTAGLAHEVVTKALFAKP
jgi:hypothetical protein